MKSLRIDHRLTATSFIQLNEDCARPHRLLAGHSCFGTKGIIKMIKQSLVGAVAIIALASAAHGADLQPVLKAPAAVDQQATGYVEVYGGWASTKFTNFGESERFDGWALGGAGRGNYWVTRNVSVQVDAQAEGTSYEFIGG